ncbi:MAG: hypothetical protein COA41_07855 [Sphingopyxis sp.]|nr:MAG: hypothetical protein COA41_07855 [Sphingopyxis sp.]
MSKFVKFLSTDHSQAFVTSLLRYIWWMVFSREHCRAAICGDNIRRSAIASTAVDRIGDIVRSLGGQRGRQ